MSKEPTSRGLPMKDGHVPATNSGSLQKGFIPSGKPNPQSGHIPTTGSGRPAGPPPNAPSGVSPPAKK